MNRKVFFDSIRPALFPKGLLASQVDGITKILDYRDAAWPAMPDNELAYVLATTKWETGHSMQPVSEGYPMTGARLRAFQRGLRYAPFWGRGLVQITHDYNYQKFGIKNDPDAALKWPTALDILFRGMIFGMFTGKRLSDYFSDQGADWFNARRIVNGLDQADHIAAQAKAFFTALEAAKSAPPETEPSTPETIPEEPTALPPAPNPQAQGLFIAVIAAVFAWMLVMGLLLSIKADIKGVHQGLATPLPPVRPK